MLPITQLPEGQRRMFEDCLSPPPVIEEPGDYGNFLRTFDYFLDVLLVDFSQNVETVNSYAQFLQQDM